MNIKYYILFIFICTGGVALSQNNRLKTETFKVYGVCEMCKERIEQTVLRHKAQSAEWNIKTGMLTVRFDSTQTTKPALQQQLAAVGHDNGSFTAPDAVYAQLPACCHYSRPGNDSTALSHALHTISGVVLEETIKGRLQPIAQATVKSLHTNSYFTTDSTGVFQVSVTLPAQIVISYVGFKADTIAVSKPDVLTIILKNASTGVMQEIVVSSRTPATYVSTLSVLNTLNLGARELTKAACCNLSESFETSPSVDVSYSDAITGIKQIQLLGLSGNYTQLLTENVPEIKGLAGSFGLTFIPGPWMEGIQLTKGTGSVVNGYESIAGQINVEERKPDNSDKLLLNTYVNDMGRVEANINYAQKLNDKWSTALLTHANAMPIKNDGNQDGFLDIPIGHQLNVINRWKYADNNGWIGQLSIKALNDKRQAGQLDFDPATDKFTTRYYGAGTHIKQYNLTGKVGYVFPQHKYKSLGFIVSGSWYNNAAYYGQSAYNGNQKNVYANFIYQSIIGTTFHKFRTGLSFANDVVHENFNAAHYTRNEVVPGAFFEYTYTASEKFSAIVGLRADYHNYFGLITTPRVHIKYDLAPKTNLRLSAGSGFRMANIFAENAGVLVSARQLEIKNATENYAYGLRPEKAWNIGGSFIHQFKWFNRVGTISVDAYHTQFINQTVADMDAHPQKIIFSDLDGASYANSVQAEVNYELLHRLDLRLAYRWLQVKSHYHGILLAKPFTAPHRAFMNIAYETTNHWKFDYTLQWLSSKRLPYTGSNPAGLQLPEYSPAYIQMAGQISKQLHPKWEIYAGGENLTNYRQSNPIIDAAHPFSPYFDGAMTWGPVVGRMLYVGIRVKIK